MSLTEPFATRLPDVNVLLAALLPRHEFHAPALAWLEGVPRFATTAITEAGFLRLAVLPQIAGSHAAMPDALDVLHNLRQDANWTYWAQVPSLAEALISVSPMLGAKQVTDFLLVNLAAFHQGKLVTFDRRIEAALRPKDRKYVEVLTP